MRASRALPPALCAALLLAGCAPPPPVAPNADMGCAAPAIRPDVGLTLNAGSGGYRGAHIHLGFPGTARAAAPRPADPVSQTCVQRLSGQLPDWPANTL